MDILGARRSIEQKLLMQSVALMALVAVSGTVMGIVTGSSAVLLDGVFFTIDVTGIHMHKPFWKIGLRHNTKITPHAVRGDDNTYCDEIVMFHY